MEADTSPLVAGTVEELAAAEADGLTIEVTRVEAATLELATALDAAVVLAEPDLDGDAAEPP